MIKKRYQEVQEEKVTKANSTGTIVRWMLTKEDGPTHFATRRFEIAVGGQIGVHNHQEEHHIYVLSGEAEFMDGQGNQICTEKGDFLYISPNEEHGIKNVSEKPFVFLCMIPYL